MSKMNKRMKKVAGIIAAATLCMSMSMGVFASSPTDPNIPGVEENKKLPPVSGGFGKDKDGNVFTAHAKEELSEEVEEILKDENAIKDILGNAGYEVKDEQEVIVLGAGDISLVGKTPDDKLEVPEGGVDVNLRLDPKVAEGLNDGDVLYILHQKADGTWEILEGSVYTRSYSEYFTEYYVSAHFDSFSPVAIVKIMSDGKVAVLDKNEQQVGTLEPDKGNGNADDKTAGNGSGSDSEMRVVKTTTVKKSPKTGN